MKTRPTFAENLESLMRTHDVNQPELARRVGVSVPAVSRWLSTGRIPGGQDLLAIARVLAIDPWVLMGASFTEPLPAQPLPKRGRRPASTL